MAKEAAMAVKTLLEAVRDGLREEMARALWCLEKTLESWAVSFVSPKT